MHAAEPPAPGQTSGGITESPDEWQSVEVPDTEAAIGVIEHLEATAARDVKLEWVDGNIRIRWRGLARNGG
jgi:hypothetical protein